MNHPRGAETGKTGQTAPILPNFRRSTAARLPHHPDAPRPLVPWDEMETESEAPIMSYGPSLRPFFTAPEAMRYSPLGAPAADRTVPNPTERTAVCRSRPAVPPGA